jgi:methionyl-tRNA synthetase
MKQLYITTAIPYVNATPHIGNALDYLIADIWTRYQKQNGNQVRFQVGTDEHGNKIAAKAGEAGLHPQAYTDKMYINFENVIKKVGAEYTDFIRTTSPHHQQAVQYIWQKLQPYIYKGTYEGWYCQGCEAFVTDKEATLNNGTCPDHNQPYQKLSEENYYFKASAFTQQVREAIDKRKFEIVPAFRKHEFLELIKDGIKDISISRPKKNLSWGVPVPNDPNQIMYVWIDALANYITVLGYPDNEEWKNYWPADIQVLGKDILRFHAGIWPPILLALGLPLPKKLLVHGHISSSGTKMSKSLGNVVDPNEIIDQYGVDAFRYYFSRHIPTLDDGDFSWEKFEMAYNNELGNELGNLVQRIAAMINRYQSGVIGDVPQPEHDVRIYHDHMKALEFNRAFDEIWHKVRALNSYIEDVKPWQIAKDSETSLEVKEYLEEVLAYMAGSIVQIGDLLVPFLPTTAAAIHAIFTTGVVKLPDTGPLFPKLYLKTPDPRGTNVTSSHSQEAAG